MNARGDQPVDGGAALLADSLTLAGPGPVLLDGLDVVLVPESHAREAVARLDELAGLHAVGAVFASGDAWGSSYLRGPAIPPGPRRRGTSAPEPRSRCRPRPGPMPPRDGSAGGKAGSTPRPSSFTPSWPTSPSGTA